MFIRTTRRFAPAALLALSVAHVAHAGLIAPAYTLPAPSNVTIPNSIAVSPYSTISVASVTIGKNSWSNLATNSAGQAVVYNSNSSFNKVYLLDPANAAAGLVEIDPLITNVGGLFAASVSGISASGAVAGTSVKPSGSVNNNAGWVYRPGFGTSVLALTGALNATPYYYLSGTTYTYNQPSAAVGGNGWTVGNATRYSGASASSTIGTDPWIQDPSTIGAGPVIIPLANANESATVTISGATNTTFHGGSVAAVNASGVAIGLFTRYMGLTSTTSSPAAIFGADAYMYKSDTTTQIGLIGTSASTFEVTSSYTPAGLSAQPYQSSTVAAINSSGSILGTSNYYATNSISIAGVLGWVYTPSTAPGTFTYDGASTATSFTPAQNYLTNSAGTYQQVGLVDSGTPFTHLTSTGLANTGVAAINDNGQAVGVSAIYNASTNATVNGNDLWYFSGVQGSASVLITPSSAFPTNYLYANSSGGNNFATSSVVSFNSNGMAAGTASRFKPASFTGLGVVGWVYNPADNKTFEMISYPDLVTAATGASDRYFTSTVEYVSNSGLVLGYYNTYAGTTSTGPSANKIFAWYDDGSATGNFVTLSGLISPSDITTVNWSVLSGLITVGADGTLYGFGKEFSPSTTQAVFELNVPEPASLALLGLAALPLLGRRRNKQ